MFGIYLPVDTGYFIHFQGLLYSFKDLLDTNYKIHIIDIGLSAKDLNILHGNFRFLNYEINKIPWDRESKINYKFKIDTIEQMLKSKYDYCIMLDAKNHLKKPLSSLLPYLEDTPVLIQDIKPYLEQDWTHDEALKCMGVYEDDTVLLTYQYQSNNPVFNMSTAKDIMKDIVKYGNMPNALAPLGSKKSFEGISRHRQDQSVISIVCKKHGIKPTFYNYSNYHNTIHL
jgi:hypothetical protein